MSTLILLERTHIFMPDRRGFIESQVQCIEWQPRKRYDMDGGPAMAP